MKFKNELSRFKATHFHIYFFFYGGAEMKLSLVINYVELNRQKLLFLQPPARFYFLLKLFPYCGFSDISEGIKTKCAH